VNSGASSKSAKKVAETNRTIKAQYMEGKYREKKRWTLWSEVLTKKKRQGKKTF